MEHLLISSLLFLFKFLLSWQILVLLQSDPLPIPAFFWNFPLECICYITIQPNCKVHLTYILSLTSPLLFVTNGLLVRGEIGEHTRNVRHNHYTPVLHDASLYTTSFQVCIIQNIEFSGWVNALKRALPVKEVPETDIGLTVQLLLFQYLSYRVSYM